jgi:phenylalanyl-tRNA synthetase alpha chain
MRLPQAQVAVLEAASPTDARPTDSIAAETDLDPPAVTRAALELQAEGLLAVEEHTEDRLTLTEEARTYREDGLPEVRLYRAALAAGADTDPVPLGQVIGAADLGDLADIALANYNRKGYGSVDSGTIVADPDADPDADPEAAALDAVATALGATADSASVPTATVDAEAGVLDRLVSRGLLGRRESTTRTVTVTDDGVTALMEGVETAETVSRLTSELLTSGDWRDVTFEEYNVTAAAETTHGGRLHPMRAMAERVKEVLVGMGFREMDGPHVDAEFWINDCLFMPQDHPARTHWDRFGIEDPTHIEELPDALLERVRSAHLDGVGEDGDGYHSPWSEEFARALTLRGHTTSLSMRYLSGFAEESVDPPERYFSVEKAYRNDTIDDTHLLEFFQIEGWVLAEDLSVRDLMGTFEEFYAQFGITDLEFKPTYNPYTEPSFEIFGTHPTTGDLVEIGNSGMFREEVLSPLGVDGDVMAWGLALERLMMLATGAEDIRDIHGTLVDLDYLRTEEVIY